MAEEAPAEVAPAAPTASAGDGAPEPAVGAVDSRYDRRSERVVREMSEEDKAIAKEFAENRETKKAAAQAEFLMRHFETVGDVQEAFRMADYALERLGFDEEEVKAYVKDQGPRAVIEGNRLGEALLELDPNMTPTEARRAKREFMETPGNVARLNASPGSEDGGWGL